MVDDQLLGSVSTVRTGSIDALREELASVQADLASVRAYAAELERYLEAFMRTAEVSKKGAADAKARLLPAVPATDGIACRCGGVFTRVPRGTYYKCSACGAYKRFTGKVS